MSTPLMGYYAPSDGADSGTWGSSLNAGFTTYVDNNFAGLTTLSLSSSSVLLTAAQARSQMLRLTGTLLANVAISPDSGVLWNGVRCVENLTTGFFSVSLQNGAGSVSIPQNRRGLLFIDSTNGPRFVSMDSSNSADTIPAGIPMTMFTASAPTGWAQASGFNDFAMRIVNGAGGGSGGSVAFSTVFGRTGTDPYTLQIADIPSHSHGMYHSTTNNGSGTLISWTNGVTDTSQSTQLVGGGGGHSHTMDMRVRYADFIAVTHT